jgi:hypothetical protein
MRFIASQLLLLFLLLGFSGGMALEVKVEYRAFRRIVAGSFTGMTAWEEVNRVTLVPLGGVDNEAPVVLYGSGDNDYAHLNMREKIGKILKENLERREELLNKYRVLLRAARELANIELYNEKPLLDLQPDMERLRREVRLIAMAVAGNHERDEL